MSAALKARSSGALVVNQVWTVTEIDDLVTRIRRKVEKVLPWFDPDQYRDESERQETVLAGAEEATAKGKRTLEAYRRAHELRR